MNLYSNNKPLIVLLLMIFTGLRISGQSTNDVLNVLISNGTISQQQADSIRADAAIKQQDADANKKSFFVNAARQVQLAGYTQFRYQILDEAGKKDGFDIRRARLDLKGKLTPFFGYRLQADFVDKPKMIDAYGDIRLADYFTITAGQFKIPFSMESVAADNSLETPDRAQVVEALVARSKDVIGNQNGRDIGIQAGGVLGKNANGALLEYSVGVFNGSGINVADTANEAKDIAGRVVINPLKGLSLGVSGYNGWGRAIKPDEKGKSQVRNRFGVEASYITPRISLKSEYIQGQDGITDRKGGYFQAGYFVLPKLLQVVLKYDVYDPSTQKTDNISTMYTAGANLYFNPWSKLQIFYTVREEEGPSVNNNYFVMQFQIGF